MSDKKLLGIDEAGRGCVIGPLVIAAVLMGKKKLKALTELGVKDSKRLTRRRREQLRPAIEGIAARVTVIVISPKALAENLNTVELKAMARIIKALRPDETYIDMPVNPQGISKYCAALRERLKANDKAIELIGENRADQKYPIVGAASIVAKVRRDKEIEALRRRYGDFGWGYPSESKTRKFLKSYLRKHGDFPDCVRLKWKTVGGMASPAP